LYVVGVDKSVDEETIKSLKIIKAKTTLNLHRFTMKDFEGKDEPPSEEVKAFIEKTGLINDKTLSGDYLNNDDVGALEGLVRDEDKKSVMEEYQKSMNFDMEKPFSEEAPVSVILVLNKVRFSFLIKQVDLLMNRRKIQELKFELEAITHFEKIFITSCKTGYGIPELVEYLEDTAPKAIHHATPEKKFNGTEIDVVNDIIKGALMQRYYQEVPYHIVYNVIEFLVKSNGRIKLTIKLNVLKRSHRHVVYGPQGKSIKAVTDHIRYEVTKRYGQICEVWIEVV
jgi:hypothetical protein